MTESTTAPRWDLTNVYPSLESDEFKAALQDFEFQIQALEELFATRIARSSQKLDAANLAGLLGEAVRRFNDLYEWMGTLRAYISSFVSTDSRDLTARRIMSQFQQTGVRVQQLGTRFQAWIGSLANQLDALVALDETVRDHAFALSEIAEQSQYLMSEVEESLASELGLSGHQAWAKLQGTITSQLSVDFELGGQMRKLPLPALINLHSHPD
ncbi:MAG: hypothetical protein JW862_13665, partial [Anaerolineales bacterium]|nr:hypothetical protein [Anaerolineales bacterium]